jgi:hypothetical protein
MNNKKKNNFCSLFIGKIVNCKKGLLGDSSGGGTPGSIPNPAVKPTSADGT